LNQASSSGVRRGRSAEARAPKLAQRGNVLSPLPFVTVDGERMDTKDQLLLGIAALECSAAANIASGLVGPGMSPEEAVKLYRQVLSEIRIGGGLGTDSRGKKVGEH
jgi:hypothetical protein